LGQLGLREAVKLHEILHSFLTPFLKQIYLTAHQVRIPELWKFIDAFCRCHEALVMLADFPLNYRFQ
jgi:hypothetical protein